VLPGLPEFFRNPYRDHGGRLLIDATVPLDRRDEFLRKRVPGADTLDLARYFGAAT
jgi:4-hydroxybenzoate decarboxylase